MEPIRIEQTIERLRATLERNLIGEAIAALLTLRPADRAEAFAELEEDEQAKLLSGLDIDNAAQLFEQLEDDEAADAATLLTTERLADVLDEMEPDDAADVLGDLEPDTAASVLAQMDAEQLEDVMPLLRYGDETSGGLMTPAFPHLRRLMTCQQAIDYLRALDPDTETPYYLYVLDRAERLIGIVGLRDLIVASPESSVEAIMTRDVISVPLGTDQEECARLISKYSLLALPVVDSAGRLVGVINHDDIVEVMEEEATEDIYRLANVGDSDLQIFSPVSLAIRKRLPWLVLNLGTAFLAASVVGMFEATIAQLAVLAALQSIVAGQGGNAGTQTLALMVRGLALGEIAFGDAREAVMREAGIGLLNGVAVGSLVAVGAYLWKGIPLLGVVIGVAMIGNLIAAGIAGTLVPLTLKAFNLDPALASAVIVTTVTDCVGFGLFLGLATLMLPYIV